MGWRTILWQLLALLTTLIVTHGEEFEEMLTDDEEYYDPEPVRMWTDPFEPTAGDSFDVFCSHKGYNIDHLWLDIFTLDKTGKGINDKIFTDRVDNTTVKYSVKRTPPGKFQFFKIYCLSDKVLIDHLERWVAPEPDVSDFECRWEEDSDAMECTFSQLGEEFYWDYISYFLAINDSDRRVLCKTLQNKSRVQCNFNGFSPSDLKEDNPYKFKLFVDFVGKKQMQEFNLFRQQFEVPKWFFKTVEIYWLDPSLLACLKMKIDYVHFVDVSRIKASKYQWRILLQPLNPRQEQWEAKVWETKLFWNICFDYPLYGNQHYKLHIWRRFDKPDSPWTSTSRVFLFSTRATVPDRAPHLLPNGFNYDQEKGELYVYWKPLDELEFGSTDIKYAVSTDSGQKDLVLGNHSALISNWSSTQPATVAIWSENSEGRSANRSHLDVPILTNADRRQPQNVWYHIDNNTVTWLPPLERDKLIGYTFYWCLISKNNSSFCDDLESIQFIELSESEELFQMDKSITLYRTAVAAKYSENISGGMIWSRPRPTWITKKESISYLVLTVIFVMVATLGLFFLFWKIFRKLRAMSDIKVELPDFLMNPLKTATDLKDLNLNKPPIMANISPRVMNIVLGKPLEESIEGNNDTYVSQEDSKSDDINIEPDLNLLSSSLQSTSTAFAASLQEDSHDPPATLPENLSANVAGYTEMSCIKNVKKKNYIK